MKSLEQIGKSRQHGLKVRAVIRQVADKLKVCKFKPGGDAAADQREVAVAARCLPYATPDDGRGVGL